MNLYYCVNCRKQIKDLNQVLLIDSSHPKSFCSESCIEKFFKPYVEYFSQYERDQRAALGIVENLDDYDNEIQECMAEPDAVFRQENEIGESIYFAFRKNPENKLITILGVLMFENRPSFIFFNSSTKIEELANLFKMGEEIEIVNSSKEQMKEAEKIRDYLDKESLDNRKGTLGKGGDAFEDSEGVDASDGAEDLEEPEGPEDPEFQKYIELKKSQQLAKLIENLSPNDLGVESFPLYDKYLQPTLENPDEVFEIEDDDNDTLYVYIKVFNHNDMSFYYIVVCHLFDTDVEKDQDVLIPIVSFPTIDSELYSLYQEGKEIVGPTRN